MVNGTAVGFLLVGVSMTIVSFFSSKLILFSILGIGMFLYGLILFLSSKKTMDSQKSNKTILVSQNHHQQYMQHVQNVAGQNQNSMQSQNMYAPNQQMISKTAGPLHGMNRSSQYMQNHSTNRHSHNLHSSQSQIHAHAAHAHNQTQNHLQKQAPSLNQNNVSLSTQTMQNSHVHHKVSATKFCPNCKQTINAHYKHCPHCGFLFHM
jgi:hypothetical protein